MRLGEYLTSINMSVADFAKIIGVKSRATIYRYMNGGGRVPSSDLMHKIFNATHGQVTANDFYGLPTKQNGKASHK